MTSAEQIRDLAVRLGTTREAEELLAYDPAMSFDVARERLEEAAARGRRVSVRSHAGATAPARVAPAGGGQREAAAFARALFGGVGPAPEVRHDVRDLAEGLFGSNPSAGLSSH